MGTELTTLPMFIHMGDVIVPWNVDIDGCGFLNRFVEDLRRHYGNPPGRVNAAMETIGSTFTPTIETRGLNGIAPETDEDTLQSVISKTFPKRFLSWYVMQRGKIPSFAAAILFQLAMQELGIPCCICRGWITNVRFGHKNRLLFPDRPIDQILYTGWNMVELENYRLVVDCTAGIKSVGSGRKATEVAGYFFNRNVRPASVTLEAGKEEGK